MKHTWTRQQPTIDLDAQALEALLEPFVPGARVVQATQIVTGMVNTIYRVSLTEAPGLVCVKIGQRGHGAAALEYVACRRVSALIPVPTPLGYDANEPVSGHPCVVSEWAAGERLDMLAETLCVETKRLVTRRLGTMLASLHEVRFAQTGLLEADPAADVLRVVTPFRLHGDGLLGFAESSLGSSSHGVARLGETRARRLLDWLREHAHALDAVAEGACLCHSDFGTENVLLDGDPADGPMWVLDWEFACAGTPTLDLGHLLRTPLLPTAEFEALLAESYREAGGVLRDTWAFEARLTDLFAWLSFLQRDHLAQEAVEAAIAQVDALLAVP